ncbi:MAG: hypothetical protein IKP75_04030 [Oscillospiraceae bacterium]|nr:hypothetical protein [Oscillospiraceae bacterium]
MRGNEDGELTGSTIRKFRIVQCENAPDGKILKADMTESEIVAELMKMYQKLT